MSQPLPDLIEDVLPAGEGHLFSGASGAGKTALWAMVLTRIRDGEPIFGKATRKPSFIGVICADRRWKDHEKWYEAAGFEKIPHYSIVDDLENMSGAKIRAAIDRVSLLRQCIARLCEGEPPRDALIHIDPAALFMGGNLLDYDKCATHLIDIQQMCIRYEITLTMSAHAGKQKMDAKTRYARPQDRVSGSAAQTGYSGTTFHLAPPSEVDEKADWYEFTAVPHHAPAFTIQLERDDDGLFTPKDRVVELVPASQLDKVLALVPQGEVDTASLQRQVEIELLVKRTQFKDYIGQLIDQGRLMRIKRGFVKRPQVN